MTRTRAAASPQRTAIGDNALEARDVRLTITPPGQAPREILRGVDLHVAPGEIVGLVGESGSGKTMFARTVTGLLPEEIRPRVDGSIRVRGEDLVDAPEDRRRSILRHDVSYIFQDPMSHLNPTMRIGRQIMEAAAPGEDVRELLRSVGLPGTDAFARRYPHTLSGGMRQRVLIACALAKRPQLLIADEPTTALDVTVQAQVLELLAELTVARDIAVLLITHDLAVVAQNCARVYVMYAGEVVEDQETAGLLRQPAHPYTDALMAAVHDVRHPEKPVRSIPGGVPDPTEHVEGCRFMTRCGHAVDACEEQPPLRAVGGARSRCWFSPPTWSTEAP